MYPGVVYPVWHPIPFNYRCDELEVKMHMSDGSVLLRTPAFVQTLPPWLRELKPYDSPPCATHLHGKEAAMTSLGVFFIGHRKSWDKLTDELHKYIYIYIWADAGLHSSCKDTSYRSKHKKTKWPGVQPTHSSLWEFNLTSLPESCISQWLHQRNKQFSDFYGENCSYRCVAKFSTAGRETQSSKDHGCGIGWRSNKKWWKSIFHQKIFRSPHHQA